LNSQIVTKEIQEKVDSIKVALAKRIQLFKEIGLGEEELALKEDGSNHFFEPCFLEDCDNLYSSNFQSYGPLHSSLGDQNISQMPFEEYIEEGSHLH